MSEIPKNIRYIVAMPRMKKYIDYAADIYDIYLDYIDPNDIHVYSIDEAFIDATGYLEMYKMDAREFAKFLINQIASRKHIQKIECLAKLCQRMDFLSAMPKISRFQTFSL